MKPSKYFFIIFLFAVMTVTAYAQDDVSNSVYEPDIRLNECLRTSNYTSSAVCNCYEKGYKDWIQEMNRIYNELLLVVNKAPKNCS